MKPTRVFSLVLSLVLISGTVVGAAKRLNNFVVEHVNTSIAAPAKDHKPSQPVRTFTVPTAREGWLFLRLKTSRGGARVCLYTGTSAEAVFTFAQHAQQPLEAMRFVGKGTHTVGVYVDAQTRIESFIVRAIPEIIIFSAAFAEWKTAPPGRYGVPHDWDFIRRHMMVNANALVFECLEDVERHAPYLRAAGKKALTKRNVPYYGSSADRIYEEWGAPLEKYPELAGLTIDEFGAAEQQRKHHTTYAAVLDRMGRNPLLRGKKAYTFWGSGFPKEEMRTLIEAVQRNNFRWMHEGYYMHRKSTGDEAGQLKYITAWGSAKFEKFGKMFPGLIENHLLYTFGIANYHWSFDLAPDLDFKVFLDLQFSHFANEPVFKGMYGVCLYSLNSTTEELCRYGSALVRHYCIEGHGDRFNRDSLELLHIRNPGFEQELKHWQCRPAAPGSIKTLDVASLPYKNTVTDRAIPSLKKVLCTVRSKDAPNKVSQRISNLKPGACYSVRVLVSDLTDAEKPTGLTDKEKIKLVPISIGIEGADIIHARSMDRPWTTRFTKKDGGGTVVCWNFRFRVFRAKGKEAVLTLSDWAGDMAAADVGHKVIWDYIQVQPYFPDTDLPQ